MTEFINNPVNTEELSTFETMDFKPLNTAYTKAVIIQTILVSFMPVIFATVGSFIKMKFDLFGLWYPWAAYGVLYLLTFSLTPLVVRRKGYALRDHDIHYRTGVIWQKTVSLPYNRIQHVEIESNPVERFFNLATMKVFTAGGGRTDLAVPGLDLELATTLRDYVVDKAAKARVNGPAESRAPSVAEEVSND